MSRPHEGYRPPREAIVFAAILVAAIVVRVAFLRELLGSELEGARLGERRRRVGSPLPREDERRQQQAEDGEKRDTDLHIALLVRRAAMLRRMRRPPGAAIAPRQPLQQETRSVAKQFSARNR